MLTQIKKLVIERKDILNQSYKDKNVHRFALWECVFERERDSDTNYYTKRLHRFIEICGVNLTIMNIGLQLKTI